MKLQVGVLGFSDSGVWFKDLGFRVSGVWFKDIGSRVSGLGSRVYLAVLAFRHSSPTNPAVKATKRFTGFRI